MTIPVPGDAPSGVAPRDNTSLNEIIRQIYARISEFERRTLYSVAVSTGGLTVQDGGSLRIRHPETGNTIYYAGEATNPNFEGAYVVAQYRNDGTMTLVPWQVVAAGHPLEGNQVMTWHDRDENILIRDSWAGAGLDRPWLSIYGTHQYENVAAAGAVFAYRNLPVANVTTEQTLWEGRIPLVSHPRIEVYGTWGSASGSNTQTYRIYASTDLIGTWSGPTAAVTTGRASGDAGFDLPPEMVGSFSDVRIQVTCIASGTGNVACEVYSAYLRGVPL